MNKIDIKDGIATINLKELKFRQNVAKQGEDRTTGKRILRAGHVISPAEVAVAATVGKSNLLVSRLPNTIIISSGDELIDIDKTPEPYQIRKSNVYNIHSELKKMGYRCGYDSFKMTTKMKSISHLKKIVEEYEVVIMSGGVSMGKFDYFPQVLEELKVEKLFHKVTQRPGKPFWFGKKKDGPVVFALPGNPVSTFVGVLRYVIPWLKASLGLEPLSRPMAILAEDHSFKT